MSHPSAAKLHQSLTTVTSHAETAINSITENRGQNTQRVALDTRSLTWQGLGPYYLGVDGPKRTLDGPSRAALQLYRNRHSLRVRALKSVGVRRK